MAPPRGIKSYGMRLNPTVWPPKGIESYGVAPPAGSNLTVWPLPQDRILQCGPPRVIEDQGSDFPLSPFRLPAVAPTEGSDFPLWPLPGIKGHTAGSFDYFSRACSRLKGTTCEKCFDGRTILPKDYHIHACDLL
jgi:hypothetical protein